MDDAAFRRNTGRLMLPGEYGCYRSHIKALNAFLATADDLALIVEDDVELCADLRDRVQAAFEAVTDAGVIKFFNHRVVGFRKTNTSSRGDDIGRAIHGQPRFIRMLCRISGGSPLDRKPDGHALPLRCSPRTGLGPWWPCLHDAKELGEHSAWRQEDCYARHLPLREVPKMETHRDLNPQAAG